MNTKNEKLEKTPCDCKICNRSREFKKHLATIEDEDAKKWFINLFDYVYELEEEYACEQIYSSNLERVYPKIYREMKTIRKLEPGDEKFPEINI